MDGFHVVNDTEGQREVWTFDGNELDEALVKFLIMKDFDRKVSLTYFGEEYEEE